MVMEDARGALYPVITRFPFSSVPYSSIGRRLESTASPFQLPSNWSEVWLPPAPMKDPITSVPDPAVSLNWESFP